MLETCMTHSDCRPCRRQGNLSRYACERGVALALLLWFLAAMTMLVASIGYLARADIKLTQLQVAEAKAKAAGDGAIRLMLAEVFASNTQADEPYNGRTVLSREFDISGTRIRVEVLPLYLELEGRGPKLLDINSANRQQLQNLFGNSAKLRGSSAENLATAVIKRRREPGQSAFRAIEDLLLLDGMNRLAFESIRDRIFVAPAGVDGAYRVDAYVFESGQNFLRRRWINANQSGVANLPWRYFRTEAIRIVN